MSERIKSNRISPWIAWGMFGLVMLGFAGILALDRAGCPPAQPLFSTEDSLWLHVSRILLETISPIAFSLLGVLIITYRPDNRIGWLASFFGLVNMGTTFVLAYGVCVHRGILDLPGGMMLLWLFNILTWLFAVLFLLFVNLFPDGRFLSPRWQRLSLIMIGALSAFAILQAFWPGQLLRDLPNVAPGLQNPYALSWQPSPFWDNVVTQGKILTGLTFGLLSIFSLATRWRRAKGDVRQQIKWLALFFMTAGVIFISVEFIGYTIYPAIFQSWFYPLELSIFFTGFPVVLGLAVFKYRLYDIDVVIGRTLVYGLLTLTLIGVYFGSVIILQWLFTELTGAQSPFAIVLSTLLIAALFQPVRERFQRGVNRFLYGQRDDPLAVLKQLGDVLVSAESPTYILPRYADTIAESLRLPFVAIQTNDNGRLTQAAQAGSEETTTIDFLLTYHSKDLGRLVVSPQNGQGGFTPADQRLLEQIATQTAAAVHAVQLSGELQQSRQRLVTTREEERRRLRRDLHDGLGPVLAGQGLKLTAARHLLDKDPGEVRQLLDEVMRQNEATVGEVRRLVYELRPPALDDLGLVGAIEQEGRHLMGKVQLAVTAMPVPLPDLPAAVEVVAYRIVMEALTNVARHAAANACQVRLVADDNLLVEIVDDGVGFPTTTKPGVGLASMRERTAELGGEFTMATNGDGGTCIKVILPC